MPQPEASQRYAVYHVRDIWAMLKSEVLKGYAQAG